MPLSSIVIVLKRFLRLLRNVNSTFIQLPRITRWPTAQQLRHAEHVLSPKEKRIVRLSLGTAALAFIALMLQVAGTVLAEVPKNGGVYREAIVGNPQFINPLFASANEADTDLARLVFSGLMRYDENGVLMPDLATSFAVNEKQTEFVFTLRPNIVWHDGEPLTVNDVLFTFSAIQDPVYGSPLRVSFQGVTITQVDERSVKFTLEKPFAPFIGSLTIGIVPAHIFGPVDPRNARLAPYNTRPIGSGPFKFKELTRNGDGFVQSITLERNTQFYRQPPYLDMVQIRFYSSSDDAVQDVRSKQVDGLHFVPKQLKGRVERKHIALYTLQLPRYTALFFNPKQAPLLKTKEVRQALGLAIDKNEILNEVLEGDGVVINSPILEGFVGYDAAFHQNGMDLARADELLTKAGWQKITRAEYIERRGKTIRETLEKAAKEEEKEAAETATSTDVGLEIQRQIDERLNAEVPPEQDAFRAKKDALLQIAITTVSDEELAAVAQRIASSWRALGAQVTIRAVNPRDVVNEVLRPRTYDVLLYGEIVGADPDPFPFWHSSQVDYPGLNLATFINRKSDTLLEEARVATDQKTRVEKYRAFQEILREEYPAAFLYAPTYTYAVSTDIKGITTARIVSPADRFNDIEGRYIKTKRVWK